MRHPSFKSEIRREIILTRSGIILILVWFSTIIHAGRIEPQHFAQIRESSSQLQFGARGALDENRFGTNSGSIWKGLTGKSNWWLEIEIKDAQQVGAILQIVGNHSFVLQNAPASYCWQSSDDGISWHDIMETQVQKETRAV